MKESKVRDLEVVDLQVVEAIDPVQLAKEAKEEGLQYSPEELKELVEGLRNTPYVKVYDTKGGVANPVKKGNPYMNPFMNRRDRRAAKRKETKNPKNNKRGTRLVVTKIGAMSFTKADVVPQIIEANTVPVYNDALELVGMKSYPRKVIVHNLIK